jgi:general secretion pathway protein K
MSSPHPLRRSRCQPPSRQRGIALLVAIMLVALGTIVAASVAYENAMTARKGAATFGFEQSVLVAEAAETFAAWGLREVYRADSKNTYIGQGWDKPQGPFEVVPDVMLTATLEDMQGRFNLNLLVQDGQANLTAVHAFEHLLVLVGIEPRWAGYLVDWIDPDMSPSNPEGAEDSVYLGQSPPYRTANMYITSASELLALPGFGHERYQKLAPYVTALPADTKINICTASGVVLDSLLPAGRQEFSLDPDGLQKHRLSAGGCFPSKPDFDAAMGPAQPPPQGGGTHGPTPGNPQNPGQGSMYETTSSYFKLTSYITIGTAEFNLYSVLLQERGGTPGGGGAQPGNVRPIMRSFTPD